MLSLLECRNGLREDNSWEITQNKICHSYEAQHLSGAHRKLQGRFKEWKACLVEIGQTAHKLETNARANFPMAENLAYQCKENEGEKHDHADIFVARCGFQAQY